jgi:DNA-binding response OmpR family regulator
MPAQPPSVLVVEDEESVRTSIVDVLSEDGFDVASADSAWKALDIVEKKKFDLVIADVGLSDDLTGIELAQCARSRRPTLKCLFISGRTRPAADDPERDDFIGKPFRKRELLGCVWELLQRRVGRPALDWARRQAERALTAAKVDCRRHKRRNQGPIRQRLRARKS